MRLEIINNVFLKSYPNVAYLSMAISNCEQSKNELADRLYSLCYEPRECYDRGYLVRYKPGVTFDSYESLKCLDCGNFSNFDFKNDRELDKNLRKYLNEGYYLALKLNNYYLPERRSYKVKHYDHFEMIIGYDSFRRKYLLGGYNGDFVLSRVAKNDLFSSFRNSEKDQMHGVLKYFKLKQNSCVYEFQNSRKKLLFYRTGNLSYLRNCEIGNEKFEYTDILGMNIYSRLKELILNDPNLCKDRLVFYIFWEHKFLMMRRFRNLQGTEELRIYSDEIREYETIVKKAMQIRILQFENLKTRTPKNMKLIYRLLCQCYELEVRTLNRVLGL